MIENWRIAIYQMNYTVGDLKGNRTKIIRNTGRAKDKGID
jgi:predicted amidohydrolase